MALWIEENLPAVLLGFGLGAGIIEWFSSASFIWIVGGFAGMGVTLPLWQIFGDKLRRR